MTKVYTKLLGENVIFKNILAAILIILLIPKAMGTTTTSTFTLEYDSKYFDPNVQEDKRWVEWKNDDPMIYIGRLNINAEERDIALPVRFTNKGKKASVYTSSSCSYISVKLGGGFLSYKELETNAVEHITLQLVPSVVGNIFCNIEFRVGNEKSILKIHALVQDKGVQ